MNRSAQSEVSDLVDRINRAWLLERGETLAATLRACFAEDAVVRGPGFALLGSGREFAVSSYVNFTEQCELKDFCCERIEIDFFGETAVAQYGWTIDYTRNGDDFSETGHDMLTLMQRDGRWLVVWRAVLPVQNVSA